MKHASSWILWLVCLGAGAATGSLLRRPSPPPVAAPAAFTSAPNAASTTKRDTPNDILRDATTQIAAADPAQRPSLAEQTAFNLAQNNPVAAVEWAASLPSDLRAAPLHLALQQCAQAEPLDALALLQKYPDAISRRACLVLVNAFPRDQIGGAMDWVNTLPDEHRRAAAARLIERVADTGTDALAAWIDSPPNATGRDLLLASLTRAVSGQRPDTALIHASRIADPTTRSAARQDAFRTWARQNPLAARQWLKSPRPAPEDATTLRLILETAEIGGR